MPYRGPQELVELAQLTLTAQLGSDLISNGAFAANLTGWAGANWAWSAGTALHSAGATTALSQAAAVVVAGTTYKLTYDVVGGSAGTITPSCGGMTMAARAFGSASYAEYFTASATTALAFAPTTDFDGALDNVVLKALVDGTGDLTVDGDLTVHSSVNVDGILDVVTFLTPYAQVVTVAKSGGDFTTIQGAIDSITDATTTKRYCIRVMSGVYTEAVTMKDYVDIIGAGRTNTIISGTSGTVLTFPANKGTVSELGINVNYGALGVNSAAVTSAGDDSALKDCDITVTKSGGNFKMNGVTITAGSFRMSDCYFTYSDTSGATATSLIQSAVVQSGVLTNVIMNNNEMTITTTDTNDEIVGFETTANVTGTCLLANNVININTGAAAASATGVWAYGTSSGAIFNQNRLTINCNSSAYGFWIDSAAGGAVIDTRHNEIIVTSAGAALSAQVAVGDTWNSCFDKITAANGYSNNGTVTFVSSPIDGAFTTTGAVGTGDLTVTGTFAYATANRPTEVLMLPVTWFVPAPDGADNAVTVVTGYDGTNYRAYERFTGLADTQDMDMVCEYRLPDNYAAFTGSNSLSIGVRSSDHTNNQILLTLRDSAGNVDSTINSYDISCSSSNVWETKTVEPGSSYTAGEGIILRVRVVSLDTSDTVDFSRIQLSIKCSR